MQYSPLRSLAIAAYLFVFSSLLTSSASAQCLINCTTYTKTKYPIVLAHGAFGFEQAYGVLNYWYGGAEALTAGGAKVFVTQVSPFNSSEARGEELLAQIQNIIAITGSPKVNIIAHAGGAFDARYVASVAPQLVASVTSIAGPHLGSAPFDLINKQLSSSPSAVLDLSNATVLAAYRIIAGTSSNVDLRASAQSLSYSGAAAFNRRFPMGLPTTTCGQGPSSWQGIQLYSWTGIATLTNALDMSDPHFATLALLVPGKQTEGFTERCESHFGKVIRDDYFHNHLDSINHLLGLRSPIAPDPLSLLRAHANRLKTAGL